MVRLQNLFLFFITIHISANGHSLEEAKRLLSNITSGYDRDFRPVLDQLKTVVVNATFDLVAIQDFNEVEEKISMTGQLFLSWKDELLTWNPVDFEGTESLTIPTTKLWIPELLHANPADEVNRLVEDWQLVVLHYDGTVEYFPSGIFTSTCSIDVTYYPFDIQFCELLFTIWGYNKKQVKIKALKTELMKTFYKSNGVWSLRRTRARIKTVGTLNDSVLSFEVTLKREPRFVVINVIIPIVFIEILNPLVFLMTNESGERISYCLAVLLTIAVFLTLVGDNIPKTSNPLSIYSYFLLSILVISVVIAFAAIYSLRLYYRADKNKIGSCWKTVVFTFCCKEGSEKDRDIKSRSSAMSIIKNSYRADREFYQLQENSNHSESSEGRQTYGRTHRQRKRNRDDITWNDVGKTVDRIFLVFFSVITIINTVVFLSIMATGQSDESPN